MTHVGRQFVGWSGEFGMVARLYVVAAQSAGRGLNGKPLVRSAGETLVLFTLIHGCSAPYYALTVGRSKGFRLAAHRMSSHT